MSAHNSALAMEAESITKLAGERLGEMKNCPGDVESPRALEKMAENLANFLLGSGIQPSLFTDGKGHQVIRHMSGDDDEGWEFSPSFDKKKFLADLQDTRRSNACRLHSEIACPRHHYRFTDS